MRTEPPSLPVGYPIKDNLLSTTILPVIFTNPLIIAAAVKRSRTAGYKQSGYSTGSYLGKTKCLCLYPHLSSKIVVSWQFESQYLHSR
jgi:hypothetical protein